MKFNTKFNNAFGYHVVNCWRHIRACTWMVQSRHEIRHPPHPWTPASRNSTPKGEIQHEIQQPVFSKTIVLKRFRNSTPKIQHEIQQCVCSLLRRARRRTRMMLHVCACTCMVPSRSLLLQTRKGMIMQRMQGAICVTVPYYM